MNTAWELLARSQARGVLLRADGDRLAHSGPLGGLTDELKAELSARRDELLALLRPPAPPPGVRLFFEAADARLCWPAEAITWTYEHAPRWYYAVEHPVPPHTPALAPHARRRCPGCSGKGLRVRWQEVAAADARLRIECTSCGRFVGWLQRRPDNPDLEWRST